ncbi:hypothetical protein [Pseudomonas sp. 5P_3.1_Bac2]|uniref:AtuA-related protein n=1 Tax=Pseudomonas sp. 5P_3.1_Bac2 TaxID=2971617 RepID=UPI0021C622E7|nr:hypothetical protein [Pseudomonas sp. 5P_3.1_Bac2]MCU1716397.1 hypothetical protein [Pseudomonas sp. 5P_3.1_Bac2]
MNLREIAHSRTGDKGDTANISVIAFNPQQDFALLLRELTTQRVLAELTPALTHFQATLVTVERYELAQLGALNFVVKGILKGGVTRSLSLDAHGKSLGSLLLNMQLAP